MTAARAALRASAAGGSDAMRLRNTPMIFMYHAVADVTEDPNHLAVSPARFAEQMAWLQRSGLRGVRMGTLVDALHAGQAGGMVGLTFDDGYTSMLDTVVPELKRYGFGATAFIISDLMGRTNEWDAGPVWPLLDRAGVAELAAAGIEIGSHTATHPHLAGLPARTQAAEVTASRARLEDLLSAPVRGFAYPYGSMDEAARHAVGEAGYQYACAVETPLAQLGPLALPRMYIGQRDTAARMTIKRRLHKAYVAAKGRGG
ncbi:MAG TPA: polysaccharide deacetylase family protein [Streptosporangiaceae bacterium]|nr:polysaccharide deacetylase family protein [Streptosporangiaceae bacterium]